MTAFLPNLQPYLGWKSNGLPEIIATLSDQSGAHKGEAS